MGFFSRLRGLFQGRRTDAESLAEVSVEVAELDPHSNEATTALDQMFRAIDLAARARGLDQVEALLQLQQQTQRALTTADEGVVLEAARGGVVRLAGAIKESGSATARTWESLDGWILIVARALTSRGEGASAANLIACGTDSLLMMRVELLESGATRSDGVARRNDLELALALVERALRRDVDAPGARDRLERLRERLDLAPMRREPAMGSTVLMPQVALPFTLIREVARGGCGVVYEAKELLGPLGLRTIALKTAHDPQTQRGQVLHEAQVAAALRGRWVVGIYDVDPVAGWIAMAWAMGGDLRSRMGQPGLTAEVALHTLVHLACALRSVHKAGWVHGDVKPANVLFLADTGSPRDNRNSTSVGLADERLVLSDFGLARRVGESNTSGTKGYVSPERQLGGVSDPRDDVYGFGRIADQFFHAVKQRQGLSGDDTEIDLEDLSGELAALRQLARLCQSAERPQNGAELVVLAESLLGRFGVSDET